MLLCASPMVREFPAFRCDPESMTLVDVVSNIKVVEDSLGAFIKQNSEQMQAIKDTFASSTAVPRPPMRVRALQNDLIDLADTPGAKKRKLGEEVVGITPLPPVSSYRDVTRRNGHSTPMQPPQNNHHHSTNAYVPRVPQPRRNSIIMYGNARTGDTGGNLELAADVSLVASGVSRDATPDQLKEFLTSKGLRVTGIELLTNFRIEEARSFTYRISIKAADYEKALNADIWPHRVGVRLFRNKRNFINPASWSAQSAQTGGNIMASQQAFRQYNHTVRPNGNTAATQHGGAEALPLQNRFVTPGFLPEVFN